MDLTGRTIEQIRFDALIGRGGMGAVYRGFDLRLKRPVAVKVLRDHSRRAPEARGRFMREARLLSRLDHPGICRVYDLIPHPEGNLLVLELIDGQTLRDVDAASWPLEKQLEMARDIADALASAHRQLILHRDLKPDNVMLTREGQVKLLDFGIARPIVGHGNPSSPGPLDEDKDIALELFDELEGDDLKNEDDEITLFAGAFGGLKAQPEESAKGPSSQAAGETFYTLRGTTVGTVAYMSPEQALGHDLTVASDMYAFGVLMQELFTGRRAYPKATLLELFQRVARAETSPIEDIDPDLRALILELESRDPSKRPSAEESRERLQVLIDRPQVLRRRRRRLFTALAALLSVAIAIGAIVYSRFESRRQAALAERFAQQASAVEWLLRAEYLSPSHDVTPARASVEAQLERLAIELPDDRRQIGHAAGHYALGRAYLALDELKQARGHLEKAWADGYRLPEVQAYLGLTLLRLYTLESEKARRIPSQDRRQRRFDELDADLRRPGVEHLKSGRFAGEGGRSAVLSIEPRHYPQALVAFGEGRLDEALAEASKAAETWPWFYEAELLKAHIEMRRAFDLHLDDFAKAQEILRRARGHAQKAAEVARSDPRVATEQCSIEVTRLDLETGRPTLEDQELGEILEVGQEACRRAVEIDPKNSRALGLQASLMQRKAEVGLAGEGQFEATLVAAATLAKRALDIDGENAPAWKSLGDIYSMRSDFGFFRGADVTDLVHEMQAAYEQAARLVPNEARYVNALGNAKCFLAEIDEKKGRDPRPATRASADDFRRSDRLTSAGVHVSPLVNLATCSMPAVRFELQVGIDPAPRLDVIAETLTAETERSAGAYRLWRQLGVTSSVKALRERLWGEPRSPRRDALMTDSVAAFDRSLELSSEDIYTWFFIVRRELISAFGAEEEEAFDAAADSAGRWIAKVLESEPTFQPVLIDSGRLTRLRARRFLESGNTGPRHLAFLRRGKKHLEKAIEEDPSGEAWLELGRLAMAEAALVPGRAPSAFKDASHAFEEAARLWPERPDVDLARAALVRYRSTVFGEEDVSEAWLSRAEARRAKLTDEAPPAYWSAGATLEGQLAWPP